jgi:serine/threonine protein kinase
MSRTQKSVRKQNAYFCFNPRCAHPDINSEGDTQCPYCGTDFLLAGRYRAIRRLGRGGFGMTFLARDTRHFDREVAIKQLAIKVPRTPENRKVIAEIFEREARVLEAVGNPQPGPRYHEQIPDFYELDLESDPPYIVQEYVAGPTLAEVITRDHGLAPDRALWLLTVMLPVLGYLHDREIIHRDVKPQNIIFKEAGGLPYLVDFGIAQFGSISLAPRAGTQGYMPPEQAEGLGIPACDLYALGATVIVALLGADALEDPEQALADWRNADAMRHLDASVVRVLAKLVHPDYRLRFQSAEEVLRALPGIQTDADDPVAQEDDTQAYGTDVLDDPYPWELEQTDLPDAENFNPWANVDPLESTVAKRQSPVEPPSISRAPTQVVAPGFDEEPVVQPQPRPRVLLQAPPAARGTVTLSRGNVIFLSVVAVVVCGSFLISKTGPRPERPSDPAAARTVPVSSQGGQTADARTQEPEWTSRSVLDNSVTVLMPPDVEDKGKDRDYIKLIAKTSHDEGVYILSTWRLTKALPSMTSTEQVEALEKSARYLYRNEKVIEFSQSKTSEGFPEIRIVAESTDGRRVYRARVILGNYRGIVLATSGDKSKPAVQEVQNRYLESLKISATPMARAQ